MIKEFLVGLSFGVDEGSLAKFNKSIAGAALKITALYASVQVAATGIFAGIANISEGFEKMGYEMRLVAPPITKVLQLRQEMMKAYSAAGIDIKKAVQASVLFNFSLAKTKIALESLTKGVAIRFLPMLTKQMDIFRTLIYANMPKIQAALTKFITFIFKAFEVTLILGKRVWEILSSVYDFFKKLDDATGGWSTIILAVVAAWKLLNLSFLATPLGLLLMGFLALLALWDDFKTFQEGGKSLVNWGKVIPVLKQIGEAFKAVWTFIKPVVDLTADLTLAFLKLATGDMDGFADSIKDAFQDVGKIFQMVGDAVSKLEELVIDAAVAIGGKIKDMLSGISMGGIGDKFKSLFGSSNAQQNLAPYSGPVPAIASPIGSDTNNNSNSNQTIHQETNINVKGSDPHSTARVIAGHQSNVNADMARNMKAQAS